MTMKILAAAALTALVAVPAFAQAQGGGAGAIVTQLVPLVLIFAIMYFLLIRPQQKKLKDHQKMVSALRRGDVVVTQGGIIGKVTKVKEGGELEVEIADNVRVRIVSGTVSQVLSKTEPANTN
jgi:preprotein translocase subunit YajC